MIVVVLGFVGAAISAYVWYKQVTPGPVLCLGSGCAAVIRSRFGHLLGLPNGALGVAYFLAIAGTPLLDAWLPTLRLLALAATSVAVILYLYLAYVQVFVLRTLCHWCLMSAALTLALLWILAA